MLSTVLSTLILCLFVSGILPPQQTIHSFVSQQRTEQYQDLKHALEVMSKIDEKTPLPDVFLKMYHVQEGTLMFEEDKMVRFSGLSFIFYPFNAEATFINGTRTLPCWYSFESPC